MPEYRIRMGGGRGGDAKTIISPNTSFGDIIIIKYDLYWERLTRVAGSQRVEM